MTDERRFPIPEGHPDHLPFIKWLGDHRLPIDLPAEMYDRLYAEYKRRMAAGEYGVRPAVLPLGDFGPRDSKPEPN